MNIKEAIADVVDGQDLTRDQMYDVFLQLMSGGVSDAQIGAFLIALRIKGESIGEITGAVEVMRELVCGVDVSGEHLVDIVGTGGDESNLFNVSTVSSFVVAAAGGRVAKHGNRSVSSKSGAADLLEAAGVNLNLSADQVAICVDKISIGFMFAPAHHSAMKYAIGPRKELGMRTIFNILGPMTNPARVKRQLIGVYDKALCRPMAEVLGQLGAEHVMVVHSADGLDEISIAAETHVAEYKDGQLNEHILLPEDYFGVRQSLKGLSVKDAKESLAMIFAALGGTAPAAMDLIVLNAGAALYVAGCADSMEQGVVMAQESITSGAASAKIDQLVDLTNSI
jgi:anthranilate phosphoribosyltransferase